MSADLHTWTTTGLGILRCRVKGCRTPHQVEVRTVTEIRAHEGRQITTTYVETGRGPIAVRDQRELAATVERDAVCTGCGQTRLDYLPIRGVHVESVTCGRRCTSAVGPSCDCSCAGANHARDHQPVTL